MRRAKVHMAIRWLNAWQADLLKYCKYYALGGPLRLSLFFLKWRNHSDGKYTFEHYECSLLWNFLKKRYVHKWICKSSWLSWGIQLLPFSRSLGKHHKSFKKILPKIKITHMRLILYPDCFLNSCFTCDNHKPSVTIYLPLDLWQPAIGMGRLAAQTVRMGW